MSGVTGVPAPHPRRRTAKADKNDETPDAGWTADGATAPTENLGDVTATPAAPTAASAAALDPAASTTAPADVPGSAASEPAASTEKPSRVRRLLVPGIALFAGLAIGLGGGALLGSALDGPRGFDRAAGHRDGPHSGGPRGDGDDTTDEPGTDIDDTTDEPEPGTDGTGTE